MPTTQWFLTSSERGNPSTRLDSRPHVILRHHDRPELDVAFLGGIDLCLGWRDDASHLTW